MKDIFIIGAGGVGRETACIIEQINRKEKEWNILGFIDDNESIWGNNVNGYSVLGGVDFITNYLDENVRDISDKAYAVVALANYKVKKNIVEKLNGKIKFSTIVHPEVYIDLSCNIGCGTIVYPGVIMTTNITIGNHVIISPKCGVGHDTVIKDYVSLLWNVNVSGFDVLEEGVLMGSGSTVIQSKTIGKGAIVGAGAVVVKDIESETTSVGVPSSYIK